MIDFTPLVKDSPFAIYTCDTDGFITYYNPAAAVLWGKSPEIGKAFWWDCQKIFYPNGLPMPVDSSPMAMTLKKGLAYDNQEISIQRPDGTFRSLKVFSRPVFDVVGTLIGSHNTLLDLTKYNEQDI